MRASVIVILGVMLAVPAAHAQAPVVGAVAHLGDCQLHTYVGEIQSVWVVQESGTLLSSVRLRVQITDNGWTSTYGGAYFPVVYVIDPDPFAGGTFYSMSCGGAFMRLDFLTTTSSPECAAEISIVPDPAATSGEIEGIDCDSNPATVTSGTTIVVNSNPETCPCVIGPIATESSTWGQIKALYQ